MKPVLRIGVEIPQTILQAASSDLLLTTHEETMSIWRISKGILRKTYDYLAVRLRRFL
jgi:hypothetical protein